VWRNGHVSDRCRIGSLGEQLVISDLFYREDGDGDGVDAGCSDMLGVAVGEGLEGTGDVPADVFSFNDGCTCINESKESLAGVGDGLTLGEVAFSGAGLGCGFSGFAVDPTRGESVVGRGSETPVCSFFFGSVPADAASNLPCTMIPDSRLETI
jgi:hypothetical protein